MFDNEGNLDIVMGFPLYVDVIHKTIQNEHSRIKGP